VAVGCDSDAEVVAGIERVLSGLAVGKNGTTETVDFVFARLRELELVRGWWDDGRASDESKARRQAALERLGLPLDGEMEMTDEALGKEVTKTVEKIVSIHRKLPPCTALVVYSGTGDPREVRRLRQLQDRHREEYRVKKWDEVTKWGPEEDEKLSRAVKKAKNGVGFMVVK
jgi:RNA exonuclease 1